MRRLDGSIPRHKNKIHLLSVCSTPSHPDLQLWRLPWRREEGLRAAGGPRGEPPVCYVSSEHCYQKPGASWEKAQAAVKQQEEEEIDLRVKKQTKLYTLFKMQTADILLSPQSGTRKYKE